MVQGFSAGGHLACSLEFSGRNRFFSETLGVSAEQIRPNGMILCYPVITSGEYAHRGSFEALLGEDAYDPEKRKEQSLELQVTRIPLRLFMAYRTGRLCSGGKFAVLL